MCVCVWADCHTPPVIWLPMPPLVTAVAVVYRRGVHLHLVCGGRCACRPRTVDDCARPHTMDDDKKKKTEQHQQHEQQKEEEKKKPRDN